MAMVQLKPNFFVVGAAKAGTTSLFSYISQHPDVFAPVRKEMKYFSFMENFNGPGDKEIERTLIRSYEEYLEYYRAEKEYGAVGDVSPDYLYHSGETIKNILEKIGRKAKIIIILRNPSDRAYSFYRHMLLKGHEKLSFQEALAAEEEREKQGWRWSWLYRKSSFYFDAVSAYLSSFDEVLILRYEELKENPLGMMKKVYRFLGVDEEFKPEVEKIHNESPKNRFMINLTASNSGMKRMLRKLMNPTRRRKIKEQLVSISNKIFPTENHDGEVRHILATESVEAVQKLERLLGVSLEEWKH